MQPRLTSNRAIFLLQFSKQWNHHRHESPWGLAFFFFFFKLQGISQILHCKFHHSFLLQHKGTMSKGPRKAGLSVPLTVVFQNSILLWFSSRKISNVPGALESLVHFDLCCLYLSSLLGVNPTIQGVLVAKACLYLTVNTSLYLMCIFL